MFFYELTHPWHVCWLWVIQTTRDVQENELLFKFFTISLFFHIDICRFVIWLHLDYFTVWGSLILECVGMERISKFYLISHQILAITPQHSLDIPHSILNLFIPLIGNTRVWSDIEILFLFKSSIHAKLPYCVCFKFAIKFFGTATEHWRVDPPCTQIPKMTVFSKRIKKYWTISL